MKIEYSAELTSSPHRDDAYLESVLQTCWILGQLTLCEPSEKEMLEEKKV